MDKNLITLKALHNSYSLFVEKLTIAIINFEKLLVSVIVVQEIINYYKKY